MDFETWNLDLLRALDLKKSLQWEFEKFELSQDESQLEICFNFIELDEFQVVNLSEEFKSVFTPHIRILLSRSLLIVKYVDFIL